MEQDKRSDDALQRRKSSDNKSIPKARPRKSVSTEAVQSTDGSQVATGDQETMLLQGTEGATSTANSEGPSMSESKMRQASKVPVAMCGKRASISAQRGSPPSVDALLLETKARKSVSTEAVQSTVGSQAATVEQETMLLQRTEAAASTAKSEGPSISESKMRRESKYPAAICSKKASISAQRGSPPSVDALLLETMATTGDKTPEASGSMSMSSLASTESSVEIKKKGKKSKHSGKKSRKHRHEGGREAVVVVNRTNILRDSFYECVGQPFPHEQEQATAEPSATGCDTDKVVAYVTSTSVDGSASAAIEKVAKQAELVKEKAVLDAVLKDLIDLLDVHSVRPEKLEADADRPNGLVVFCTEKEGFELSELEKVKLNTTEACQNGSGSVHPNAPYFVASSVHLDQPNSTKKQKVIEKHSPKRLLSSEGSVNSTKINQDNAYANDEPRSSFGAMPTLEYHRVDPREHKLGAASMALNVCEAPFVFVSMSPMNTNDRNQPEPSKDSSGYLGGSETEPVRSKPDDDEDGHEFLDMAFGAGSFTEDYGLDQITPNAENASSPATVGGGCNPGCWNNLLRPITMVSKYIQTDCWEGPGSESSFSEVVRQTSHYKGSTKILQRPCSMNISVPQRRAATGGGSDTSSVEELEKIFATYSPPPTPDGKDVSGRADMKKGMLRDRNFNLPSSAESGNDTAPPSTLAGVVHPQQCAVDAGIKAAAMAEEEPAK